MTRDEKNVQREAHVFAFILEHEIDCEYGGKRRSAYAFQGKPRKGEAAKVFLPQIRGQMTYFIALHELGHILSPENRRLKLLDAEVDAWKWALDNSEEEPTQATWRGIDRRLKSYVARALHWASIKDPTYESRLFMKKVHEQAEGIWWRGGPPR